MRLQAIKSQRWITHHPAARVLEDVNDLFHQEASDRMRNLLLLAESGMGKTILLNKFARDKALPFDREIGVQPGPWC